MKPIRLTAHARGYTARRGFSVEEVEQTIRESSWEPALRGKMECRKNFPYQGQWSGKRYATKQVRPVFVEEMNEIVVITVYTYFF